MTADPCTSPGLSYVPMTVRRPADPKPADTAQLRREAVELLARSPWWRRERGRDELLARLWHRPRP